MTHSQLIAYKQANRIRRQRVLLEKSLPKDRSLRELFEKIGHKKPNKKLSIAYRSSLRGRRGRRMLRHLKDSCVNTAWNKAQESKHQAKFRNQRTTKIRAEELAMGS